MAEKQPHGSSVLHADCRRDVFRLFMIVCLMLHRCMGRTSLHGYMARVLSRNNFLGGRAEDGKEEVRPM